MKLKLLALTLLSNPLYAHVSHHHESSPQHGVEHLYIIAAIVAVGAIGYGLYKKNKQR